MRASRQRLDATRPPRRPQPPSECGVLVDTSAPSSSSASLARGESEALLPSSARQNEASFNLRKRLLGDWVDGAPNKTICEYAHLITQAGGKGVEDLAVDPKSAGDNFARSLNRALGLTDLTDDCFEVRIPMYDKMNDRRIIDWFPIRLPHEVVGHGFDYHCYTPPPPAIPHGRVVG